LFPQLGLGGGSGGSGGTLDNWMLRRNNLQKVANCLRRFAEHVLGAEDITGVPEVEDYLTSIDLTRIAKAPYGGDPVIDLPLGEDEDALAKLVKLALACAVPSPDHREEQVVIVCLRKRRQGRVAAGRRHGRAP